MADKPVQTSYFSEAPNPLPITYGCAGEYRWGKLPDGNFEEELFLRSNKLSLQYISWVCVFRNDHIRNVIHIFLYLSCIVLECYTNLSSLCSVQFPFFA